MHREYLQESTECQRQLGENASPTYANRVLKVFEVIASSGPVNLDEIAGASKLPRVSAWRAARELCVAGWVRQRRRDCQYEIDSNFNITIKKNKTPLSEEREFDACADAITKVADVHVSAGKIECPGRCILIDSTKRYREIEVSLVFDPLALAALISFRVDSLKEHLSAYRKYASREEIQYIDCGEALRDICKWRRVGLVDNFDGSSFAFPHRLKTGVWSSIEIQQKSDSRKGKEAFLTVRRIVIEALNECQPDAIEGSATKCRPMDYFLDT